MPIIIDAPPEPGVSNGAPQTGNGLSSAGKLLVLLGAATILAGLESKLLAVKEDSMEEVREAFGKSGCWCAVSICASGRFDRARRDW